jgi:hypothetical protein
MFAHHDMVSPPMFYGVARPHRIRDIAAIAMCLALIGGFMAHAVRPVQAASLRPTGVVVTSALPEGCPDVRVQ